jgi:hypothetical protein
MTLDSFIERWSGIVLVTLGVVLIAIGLAGYFDVLPPPFSQTRGQRLLRGPGFSDTAYMCWLSGLFVVLTGWRIHRHFVKERADAPTA